MDLLQSLSLPALNISFTVTYLYLSILVIISFILGLLVTYLDLYLNIKDKKKLLISNKEYLIINTVATTIAFCFLIPCIPFIVIGIFLYFIQPLIDVFIMKIFKIFKRT
jgi:hypothetical protein